MQPKDKDIVIVDLPSYFITSDEKDKFFIKSFNKSIKIIVPTLFLNPEINTLFKMAPLFRNNWYVFENIFDRSKNRIQKRKELLM